MVDRDEWCFDTDILKDHAINYFLNLHATGDNWPSNFLVKGRFLKLEEPLGANLVSGVTREEIRNSMFSMALLKTLGVDRYHAKFYQVN